ncbi:YSIRK-type signal peptide-containing protein [Streptococcus ruminantium]|uniref:YSIRK-type signal peptide-containing protein n=1 Tax=Streptococcus ruminantium TaxID=1917441 RepID=UPI0012DEB92B|nr:YSIRK-type signal peptide-containing protein [Streptococcus ruminantium]
MDKSTKKQRYSLRKTQMGVGSVLLATVLLTAGAAKAENGVAGPPRESLTDSIQGNGGVRFIERDKGEKWPKMPEQPERPQLGLGLGDGGATVTPLFPERPKQGLGLGDGKAEIKSGNESNPEDPKVNVPGKTDEPKEKLPETPTPLPRVQDQPQPTPKSKPEETPKAEALKQEAPKKETEQKPSSKTKEEGRYKIVYRAGRSEKSENLSERGTLGELGEDDYYDHEHEKEGKLKAAQEKYVKLGYHREYDQFNYGKVTLVIFHRFKTYIVIKTIGDDGTVKGTETSVFYGENREKNVENRVKELTDELGKFYNVERSVENKEEEHEKTITLTLRPKTEKAPEADKPTPEVPKEPQIPEVPKEPESPKTPDMPKVPEVPKKPDMPQPPVPEVPKKPEVAPKPGEKPSIPEMVPEPEKLEMDKSMKVVPGKPKKATPEAQVPEAQVPQVPQVQVPQSQAPQLPSPKEEVAKVQQQPRAIQSSAPAKSGGKQLPNTGEAASILTLVGSGMLGLLGLAFTKKRKTK